MSDPDESIKIVDENGMLTPAWIEKSILIWAFVLLIIALVPYISNQDSSIGEEEKFQYPQLEYIPEVEEFQEMEDQTEPMGKF